MCPRHHGDAGQFGEGHQERSRSLARLRPPDALVLTLSARQDGESKRERTAPRYRYEISREDVERR